MSASYLGTRFIWGQDAPVVIDDVDRRRHTYLIGQTGTGKTTLLKQLILQDIAKGGGVGVIDPHGDLVEELLDYIPRARTKDVVYFNPADLDYPIGFNPLERVHPDRQSLVASNVIATLKSIWGDVWGTGRMQYITRHTLLSLLEYEHGTLLGVNRLLSHDGFREHVLRRVTNPAVRAFWRDEFARYDKGERIAAAAAIQNKAGQFTTDALMRNILGQVKSTINLRYMMDTRRILLANLSKGRLGEDNSNLLGSLLVSQLQLAAQERASVPEAHRVDFALYIDEFQNFTTDSFASILSEARKYRLCLTLAHQYLDQLPANLHKAVFGNVGTLLAFRVGTVDAEVLSQHFQPYPPPALVELDRYTACLRLLQHGEISEPFVLTTSLPNTPRYGRKDTLIRVSRERFGRPRAAVEDKITRWLKH